MVKVILEDDLEFDVNDEAMDDMEFVELLAAAEENTTALPKVLETALGVDGKKKLYEHVRKITGRATVAATAEEFSKILEKAGESIKK